MSNEHREAGFEAFEEWARDEYDLPMSMWLRADGEYIDDWMQCRFEVWLAATTAAEQKLAERAANPLIMVDGKVYDTRDVVKLLATEQKHAALVEALGALPRYTVQTLGGETDEYLDVGGEYVKHDELSATLTQQDQPDAMQELLKDAFAVIDAQDQPAGGEK